MSHVPCPRCQTSIPSIARFCPSCGGAVDLPISVGAPAPSVPPAAASAPLVQAYTRRQWKIWVAALALTLLIGFIVVGMLGGSKPAAVVDPVMQTAIADAVTEGDLSPAGNIGGPFVASTRTVYAAALIRPQEGAVVVEFDWFRDNVLVGTAPLEIPPGYRGWAVADLNGDEGGALSPGPYHVRILWYLPGDAANPQTVATLRFEVLPADEPDPVPEDPKPEDPGADDPAPVRGGSTPPPVWEARYDASTDMWDVAVLFDNPQARSFRGVAVDAYVNASVTGVSHSYHALVDVGAEEVHVFAFPVLHPTNDATDQVTITFVVRGGPYDLWEARNVTYVMGGTYGGGAIEVPEDAVVDELPPQGLFLKWKVEYDEDAADWVFTVALHDYVADLEDLDVLVAVRPAGKGDYDAFAFERGVSIAEGEVYRTTLRVRSPVPLGESIDARIVLEGAIEHTETRENVNYTLGATYGGS